MVQLVSGRPLPQRFYRSDTREVAQALLGKRLVYRDGEGVLRSGWIVETEAYCGPEDKACHASKGKTNRTAVMFGPPGHWYVYLIYGMYHCLNIVTESEGYPAAVLIRGVVAEGGIEGNVKTDGPGKLCRAYGITRALDGSVAWGSGARLWITRSGAWPEGSGTIRETPRIGIPYAEEYRDKPWRYVLEV